MTDSHQQYSQIMQRIQWEDASNYTFPDQHTKTWLTDLGSLSVRLSGCCDDLKVRLLTNTKLSASSQFQTNEPFLLREVVLSGDDKEWVFGQTVITDSVLNTLDVDFSEQGETPLGFTVFNAQDVARDELQVAQVTLNEQTLWARRSRLWMNGSPLQVSELFLPLSPLYYEQ